MWQKDDSIIGEIEGTELEKEYKLDENFKIKIYLSVTPKFENELDIENQKAELIGHLEYLTSDIQNMDNERAILKQMEPNTWLNKTILKVLELEKYMYDKSRAKYLKYLYEKLGSTMRIIEYLIDQGEVNIPHRQTITSHLKKYFREKNLDYQKWLNENPKMRIGINNYNQIRVFPKDLRDDINEIICRILLKYKNEISEKNLINLLKKDFDNQKLIIMTWLLNNPKYSQSIYQYLTNLIYLNKKLIDNNLNEERINITILSRDPNIPFDRRTITLIVNHLNKIGILNIK